MPPRLQLCINASTVRTLNGRNTARAVAQKIHVTPLLGDTKSQQDTDHVSTVGDLGHCRSHHSSCPAIPPIILSTLTPSRPNAAIDIAWMLCVSVAAAAPACSDLYHLVQVKFLPGLRQCCPSLRRGEAKSAQTHLLSRPWVAEDETGMHSRRGVLVQGSVPNARCIHGVERAHRLAAMGGPPC